MNKFLLVVTLVSALLILAACESDPVQPRLTWKVEPTLEYASISFCPLCGFVANGMMIDASTGEVTGYRLGHGHAAIRLLHDEALGLFGEFRSSESGMDLRLLTENEFLSIFPFRADSLNLFYGIDSTRITSENFEWGTDYDLSEAYTGRLALAVGTGFVTEFAFDAGEWSEWGFTARSFRSMVAVRQNGKWGIVDFNGNIVVPFVLEHSIVIDDYTAFAKYNGTYGILIVIR